MFLLGHLPRTSEPRVFIWPPPFTTSLTLHRCLHHPSEIRLFQQNNVDTPQFSSVPKHVHDTIQGHCFSAPSQHCPRIPKPNQRTSYTTSSPQIRNTFPFTLHITYSCKAKYTFLKLTCVGACNSHDPSIPPTPSVRSLTSFSQKRSRTSFCSTRPTSHIWYTSSPPSIPTILEGPFSNTFATIFALLNDILALNCLSLATSHPGSLPDKAH